MNPTQIFSHTASKLGEGCLWNVQEQRLYWVDIDNGTLYAQAPGDAQTTTIFSEPDNPIGGFTFQQDGSMLLFRGRGNIIQIRDGQLERTLFESIPREESRRFNDLIADPKGRIFCGTIATGDPEASVYRLDCDGSLQHLFNGVGCSNGIGFSPDQTLMYYIDSGKNTVDVFDYDLDTGDIANRRVLIDSIDRDKGHIPDGMTVDAEGNLFVAIWGGYAVRKFTPTGELLETFEVPQAPMVTCPTFGGPNLTDLYITTAQYVPKGQDVPDTAGYTCIVKNAGQGVAEFKSNITICIRHGHCNRNHCVASAHTVAAPSSSNTTSSLFGLQHTGQSST